MMLATIPSLKLELHARLELALYLEMPERELEDRIGRLESDPIFARLRAAGVVKLEPYPKMRFAPALPSPSPDNWLPAIDDGDPTYRIIERIGRERFEKFFLGHNDMADASRAKLCGITEDAARRVREYLDQVEIHSEFNSVSDSVPMPQYSLVAGIELEDGRPALGFFHREVWKGRYHIDSERRQDFLATLSHRDANRIDRFLRQLELVDRRKSALYRILEILLTEQAEYLTSGVPDRRRPLTQRILAQKAGITTDALNRLIANKTIRLPWGREAAIRALACSPKTLFRDRLYDLALELPRAGDSELAMELHRRYGARISRWSAMQYRRELGLGPAGTRHSI